VTATATPEITPTATPFITPEPLPIWERVPEYEMPVEDVLVAKDKELRFIGIINIPAIGVELPVQSSWSYEQLAYTPCRYTGSAYRDGFVIIAHRFNSHFTKIGSLSIGSNVNFTDMDGNVFRYKVVSIETLQPNQTADMVSDEYALTLMTCTLSGTQRTVVRCQRR
jgi:sortase A